VACRASVAVSFHQACRTPKLSLREARLPGAAAGLSQQDQMLIAVAGEVTGGSPISAADLIQPAIGLGVPRVKASVCEEHSSLIQVVVTNLA
jgi:hypothetical protein